ncbi:hypothetical protein BC832DRAFT_231672 [Gaertneriomyces semiglobifer]|nr:hypothetical protein BC832DRAFT_231672 [Gaertneriomyces semiglobifer]
MYHSSLLRLFVIGSCAISSIVAVPVPQATGTPAPPAPPKVDTKGAFGTPVALGGGNVQTDILYPPGPNGAFEIEFANAAENSIVVDINPNPAAPPAGFIFLDPVTFKVKLAQSSAGATLQKIDWIFDPAASFMTKVEVANGTIGKLDPATNTFTIGASLGELEFEREENEYTLKTNDLNGEWGIFLPVAAVKPSAEGKPEIGITSEFIKPAPLSGGNFKNDVLFPASAAGAFEIEYTAATPNLLTVTTNPTPGGAAPAGFKFADPASYTVKLSSTPTNATLTKIDYFYSQALQATVDVNAAAIGKLDPATKAFVVEGQGEFEHEVEEKEWTLKANDLNGEWAMFVREGTAPAPAPAPAPPPKCSA